MRKFELPADFKFKLNSLSIILMLLLSACGPGEIISAAISETPTSLPPTNTRTLTPTPTLTTTPTETPIPTATPTATVTPTPRGGSANLVYAYFSMDNDDPETANAFLNIVQSGETLSVPIETTFTPIDPYYETLWAPVIAISPDASRVMAVVKGEYGSGLIEINLQDSNPSAQFVTVLPENYYVSDIDFSPDGNWVYITFNYAWGFRSYVGFLEVGTDKIIIQNECKSILGFITDESAVCSTGPGDTEIGKLTLGNFSMDHSYLDIPSLKIYRASNANWGFEGIVPEINSFVHVRASRSHFLVPNLDYYGSLSYWYAEDVENLVNSPVIAEIRPVASLFQFMPSRDKKKIAVTGINSGCLSTGIGIDPGAFTFVTDLGRTYIHEDFVEMPGTPFYALEWSPDNRVLVGLSLGGDLSIWDPMTGEIEVLHKNNVQPQIQYILESVSGIAVKWVE